MSMDIEGAGAGAGAGARAGAGAHSSENDSLPLGATGLSNILTRMDMSPAKRHKKANDGEGMGENAVLPKTLDWNTAARAESGDDARSDVSACLPAPPRPAFSAASAAAPVPVPAARVAAISVEMGSTAFLDPSAFFRMLPFLDRYTPRPTNSQPPSAVKCHCGLRRRAGAA